MQSLQTSSLESWFREAQFLWTSGLEDRCQEAEEASRKCHLGSSFRYLYISMTCTCTGVRAKHATGLWRMYEQNQLAVCVEVLEK